MIKIIHGENQVASRKKLIELSDEAKKQGRMIVTLEADKIDRAKLESALLSNSLFGEEKLLIIECLHSLPKSKKKDELIDLISYASIDIILWEKKLLTKTNFKKFPNNSQNYEFKITVKLWSFLDQLNLKSFQECIVGGEEVEFVFLMIARQIRLLIQVKENQTSGIAPFTLSKLKQQVKKFDLTKLLQIHQQLYQIDQKQKQSANLLSLPAELDLLLFNM